MENPLLAANLRQLSALMDTQDRRRFIRAVGVAGPEYMRYAAGTAVPSGLLLAAIAAFFELPSNHGLRERALDEMSLHRARRALARGKPEIAHEPISEAANAWVRSRNG